MEKFRNKNTWKNRSRLSLDGITPRRDSRGFQPVSPEHRTPAKNSGRLIDDFKRVDGFSGTQEAVPKAGTRSGAHTAAITRQFGQGGQSKLDGVSSLDKKARRKRRLEIAGASCAALLLIGVFGFGYLKNIFGGGGGAVALQEDVDPSKLRGEGDGRVNVLLMGRGGAGQEGEDLTDTMMVVSIDPINNEAGIVSIPRDLYVSVPGEGSMKINQVYWTGKSLVLNNTEHIDKEVKQKADEKGYELAEAAAEDVLGIPIHYRSMIDFKGFKKAIDTVGGVEVDVPNKVKEQMLIDGQPYTLNVKPGQQQLDGFEALAYARSRYTSEDGDFDRAERQRLIVMALKEKVLSTDTFSNPAKVAQLFDNFGSHVETDFNISEMKRLKELFEKIETDKIESIGLVQPPHDYLTTTALGGLSVVLPKAGTDNYTAIHKYIRNTLKDGYIKNENANIMVLNGAEKAGLATDKADELRSYGYNIGTVDNAPDGKRYNHTVLVDLRDGNKKYTKRYLEQRFGTIAVSRLPDSSIQAGDADFVIILGNDTRL